MYFLEFKKLTEFSPHFEPSSAGCEVHVYLSRSQCKSRQISLRYWWYAWWLPFPYFNIHCWSALNLSPGRVPDFEWSNWSINTPWSNRHFDWEDLNENESIFKTKQLLDNLTLFMSKNSSKITLYGVTYWMNLFKYFRLHDDHVILPLPNVGDIIKLLGSQSLFAKDPSCLIPRL